MPQSFQNIQTFGRGETTLPTPPPVVNVAKCGFWCKAFKVVKGVATVLAPPLGAALFLADEAFDISDSLEAIDDANAANQRSFNRGGAGYVQPSQQVRSGKLNIGL
jgi:hypothetical protein